MKELQDCSYHIERLSEKEKIVILKVQTPNQEYEGAGMTARLALEDLMKNILEVEE